LLFAIDMQNDFCPDGALAFADGDAVLPVINRLAERFDHVALTQDWQPSGHSPFASSHPGATPFESVAMPYGQQTLWSDHCRQGTEGASFHPKLEIDRAELIIRKGFRSEIDSYPAFFENDRRMSTGLVGYLRDRGLRRIFLAGLATDFACIIPLSTPVGSASNRACRGRMQGNRSGGLARRGLGGDGSGLRAGCQRSLALQLLGRSRRPVRHSSGRDDFRAQNLDRRAMSHRRLPNECKRVRLGHAVTAHDLQDGGEHDPSRPDAILELFDMSGCVDPSLR
jgi:nicotinamidase/pyrazinamidase